MAYRYFGRTAETFLCVVIQCFTMNPLKGESRITNSETRVKCTLSNSGTNDAKEKTYLSIINVYGFVKVGRVKVACDS